MRNVTLKVLLLIWLIPTAMFAQEYGTVLSESFENGIPVAWTQENVTGDKKWMAEDGDDLLYPSGAYAGNGRAALRNNGQMTEGYVTRLVTPTIALKGLFQPILCFSYANDQWTNDFDTLVVYYRTSTDKQWIELKRYETYQADWKRDTILLNSTETDSYQIAFEGRDNLGRGIVLDDIEVRSTPNCTQPYGMYLNFVSNDSVEVCWRAGFDSENFAIKIDVVELSDEQLEDEDFHANIADTVTQGQFSASIGVGRLTSDTKYYAYIKSLCDSEESDWSEYQFQTTNTAVIPYECNFNMDLVSGYFAEPHGWLCFSSTEKKSVFVNTAYSQYYVSKYSRDNTTSLLFASADQNAPLPIPADEYAYAVTPEVMNDKLNTLQVSFYSVNPDFSAPQYSIIVGAMTVPEDISTFEPIDTVKVTAFNRFEKFTVYLSGYNGDGRYIAFLSQFRDVNMFVVDDLKIEKMPSCPIPSQISICARSAEECTLTWDAGDVSKGDVVISETPMETISDDNVTYAGVKKPYVLKNLKPWTKYYLYIRSVDGKDKGEWSSAFEFLTPDRIGTLPKLYDFDINESDNTTFYVPEGANDRVKMPVGLLVRQNHDSYPELSNMSGNKVLKMSFRKDGRSSYAVFPELTDIKNTQVSFYTRVYTPSYESGTLYAGVVEDVNDMSTFVPLDTIVLDEKDRRYLIRFDKYNGNGRFFAFKVHYDDIKYPTVYVDNVNFEAIPTCIEPDDIKVESNTTSAKFSWNSEASVSSWRLLLSKTEWKYDNLKAGNFGNLELDTVIEEMPFTINGLENNETEYWYTFLFKCEDEDGQWTEPKSFITQCAGNESLPYVMDFEGFPAGSLDKFAVPCYGTEMVGPSSSKYPRLESNSYNVYQGQRSLNIASAGPNTSNPEGYSNYIALPSMNENKVGNLIMTMFIKTNAVDADIEIGVMGDKNDMSTYDSLTTISGINSRWQEVTVPFIKYQGDKQHITIKTPEGSSNQFWIDDITVFSRGECPLVYTVECTSVTDTSAMLRWDVGVEDKEWQLVVSTITLDNTQLEDAFSSSEDEIVYHGNVKSNEVEVKGLSDNMRYYAYVRTVCGLEQFGQWCMKPGEFRTACRVKSVDELGIETFNDYGTGSGQVPSCWTVGTMAETTFSIPYCHGEYSHGGNGASIYFNTSVTSNGAYLVSPKIDVDDIRRVQVSFWGACGRYSSPRYQRQIMVGVLTDLEDLSTFVPVDTIDGYSEEQYYTVQFSEYSGDYNEQYGKYVMFLSEFGKDNTFFIDDVSFGYIPECAAPNPIKVDSVGDDVINLSWGDADNRSYVVRYATHQLTDDELAAGDTEEIKTTEKQTSISGLDESTEYYVYVGVVCDGKSVWAPVMRITTECHPIHALPVKEDFNSYAMVGDFFTPECWLSYYNVLYQENKHPHIAPNGKSGNCLFVCEEGLSAPSYAVSPAIDVENIADCQVSFYAKNAPYNHQQRSLIIGVVSDISSGERIMETFVPVDTILQIQKNANEFTYHNVSLEKYNGIGKHVAFTTSRDLNLNATSGGQAGMYIDDIEIEIRPACQRPKNIHLAFVGDKYAKISFTEMGDAKQWIARYGSADFDINAGGNELVLDTTEFVIDGLEPFSEYDIYIKAVCDDGNSSVWGEPLKVKTLHEAVNSYPYVNSFEDETENQKWMQYNGSEKNAWCIGSAISKNEGGKSLYISNDNGENPTYTMTKSNTWASRTFHLNTGIYTFEFDWTCQGSYNAYMRVGLLPVEAMVAPGSKSITFGDGTSSTLGNYQGATPKQWICLEGEANGSQRYMMNNVIYGTEKKYEHNTISLLVTDSMSGDYNFMVYWNSESGYGSPYNPSAVIDEVKVSYQSCIYPVDLKIDTVSTEKTTVSWSKVGISEPGWEIFVTSNSSLVSPDEAQPEDVVLRELTAEMSYTIKDMAPWTEYYVFVRADCGENNYSDWSERLFFRTECEAVVADKEFGFEEIDGWYAVSDENHKIPACFISGNPNKGVSADNIPYMRKNDSYQHVSRTGDYALYLLSSMKNNEGGYIAFPRIEGILDTMQITFWMRKGNNDPNTGTMRSYRDCAVSVGFMTDIYDSESFTELKKVVYPLVVTSSSNIKDNADQYWVKMSVPLTGANGRYVALKTMQGGTSGTEVFIDDVVFEPISVCAVPYDIQISDTTSNSAVVSFDHYNGESWAYHLATSQNMTDTVEVDTINANTFKLENLEPGTHYYVSLKQLCGEENSEWSIAKSFYTDHTVKFTENFETVIERVPEQWQRAACQVDRVLNEGIDLAYKNSTIKSGWASSDSKVFKSTHMVMKTLVEHHEDMSVTAITYEWLISPVLNLTEEQAVMLSFKLALTGWDSDEAIVSTMKGQPGNKFMVLVSEEGGSEWERLALWSNDGEGQYVFDDISATGDNVNVDLSKYAGKRVRVAFHAQALYSNLMADFHLDDVVVNGIVLKPAEINLCETEAFRFKNFTLKNSDLNVGFNSVEYLEEIHSEGRDTLHLLSINVSPMSENVIEAAICENDVYSYNGFNATIPGIYKRKLRAGNGCDSVVVLDLKVTPAEKTYISDSICRGGTYVWKEEELKHGGIYYDTLTSISTKCDSIIILSLTISNASEYEVYDTICFGQSYEFGGLTLTESVRTQQTFKSAENCDSVVNLNLTALPDLRQNIEAAICKGQTYNENGFNGVDVTGTHVLPLSNNNGCDSTKTLNLVVVDPNATVYVERSIAVEDLPFDFYGYVFGKNTAEGKYEVDVEVSANEGCSGTVHLTLTVGNVGTGITDIKDNRSMTIIPNPVKTGESIVVRLQDSSSETGTSTAYLYDNSGILISQFDFVGNEVVIDGFHVSGLYVVRIIDGIGNTYTGKVIVK